MDSMAAALAAPSPGDESDLASHSTHGHPPHLLKTIFDNDHAAL
jgi:hypothetical protein